MITCPKCQHLEIYGALFCSECGASFLSEENAYAPLISQDELSQRKAQSQAVPDESMSPHQGSGVARLSLLLLDSNQEIPMAGRTEFTLGRVAEGQSILPDIDLAPYDAYSQGVSRLHAAIKWVDQAVTVVDLDSANGTRVNGQKIAPNVDFPVKPGDVIALGRFKIKVLIG